ncbi:MAG: SusC/RagA family TonB-linked outer membrane protein [Prevotella sp.]
MKQQLKRASVALLMTMVCFLAFAQKTITGTVKDSSGETVIGASVLEKGTQNGVVTDFDGNFTIKVSGKNPIVVSYIGMKTQTIAIGNKTKLDITLEDEATSLNDLVVIGYGAVRKKDLTGAVSTVKGGDLNKVPTSSVAEALTGKLSGVNVMTTDGSPDAEVLIRVHGGGSITGDNSPLYVIDGFPADNMNDVSANDIEDITVLKDASSTAIYGSRGANGVVLITTKSAKAGKTRINYNGFLQTKSIAKRMEVMDTYEYVMSNYEYAALRGSANIASFEKYFGVYDDLELYKEVEGIDWQDDMFGASVLTQQHNVSLNGGTEKTNFSLSGTYDYNGGLMPNNDYGRFSVQFKLNHEINKKLKFGMNVRVSDQTTNGQGTQGGTYKIRTTQAVTSQATKGLSEFVTPDFSSMTDEEYQEYLNANMTLAEQAERYWKKKQNRRFQFNASLEYKMTKELSARLEAGYGYGFNETKQWWGSTTTNASYVGGQPLADWTKQNTRSMREAFTINYNKKFGDHSLSAMVGQEVTVDKSNNTYMYGTKYPMLWTADQVFANFGQGSGVTDMKSTIDADVNLASFFGRLNYNYKERYLLTFTAREDGSSKFAKGNKWGFFPAASAAWRIIEEPFMAGAKKVFSNLKLRLSYGEAGNNRISNSQYLMIYSANSGPKRYGVGESANNHLSTTSVLANPNLTWETTITRNVGVDFGFFDERITGSFELYWNTAKDLLIQHNITAPGYTTMFENSAETENKGIDVSLNFNLVNKRDFSLSAYANINFNKSKVKSLSGGLESMPFQSGWAGTDNKNTDDYIVRVGDPIGLVYGWEVDYSNGHPYYTTDDFESYDPATKTYKLKEGVATTSLLGGVIGVRPGTLKLKDINNDGVVDLDDRTVIGDTNPTCSGGFGFNASYKDFDFTANFTYSVGNDIYNANKIATTQQYRSGTYPNLLKIMAQDNSYSYLNQETGLLLTSLEELAAANEGANAKEYWSPYSLGNATVIPTDWALEDASFLRLQSVTLGYTLPTKLTKQVGIQRCRFYVTASNLFCITGYSGYDPEVSSYSRNSSYSGLTPGIDYSSYPKSRAFTFGLNVTL